MPVAKSSRPIPASEAHEAPVEILDDRGHTVAVLPEAEALRQLLPHRAVVILVYGAAGRLILRRCDAGRWDTPARGAVRAWESIRDAGTRILETSLGLRDARLRPLLQLPPQPENHNERLHVFAVKRSPVPPTPATEDAADDYAFTFEELTCLLRDFRELVSPRFLLVAEALGVSGRRPL